MDNLTTLFFLMAWAVAAGLVLTKHLTGLMSKIDKLNETSRRGRQILGAAILGTAIFGAGIFGAGAWGAGSLAVDFKLYEEGACEQPALRMRESEMIGNYSECLSWLDQMPRDHGWSTYIERHRSAVLKAAQAEQLLAANHHVEGLTLIKAAAAEVLVDDRFLTSDKKGGLQDSTLIVPSFEILRARCLGRAGQTVEATAALTEVKKSILEQHKESPHWTSGVLLCKIRDAQQEIDSCKTRAN